MEYNQFGNQNRAAAIKQACANHGLIFTIWLTRPFTAAQARQAIIESNASGFIAEAEIPAEDAPGVPKPEAQNWPELVAALDDINIHKAVATNFAPFTHHGGEPYPEKARVLIDNDWACLTECYDMFGNPSTWPEERAFFASHLGWTETQPILGVYGPPNAGSSVESFPTRDNYRNWSVWDAGNAI